MTALTKIARDYEGLALSSIAPLLLVRSPSTVARRVTELIVDAVQTVSGRRTQPHIGDETLEGVQPLLTDRDPTAAVIRPAAVLRIRTALLHGSPREVFGTVGHTVREPIPCPSHLGARFARPLSPESRVAQLQTRLGRQSHVSVNEALGFASYVAVVPVRVFRNRCRLTAAAFALAVFHPRILASEADN